MEDRKNVGFTTFKSNCPLHYSKISCALHVRKKATKSKLSFFLANPILNRRISQIPFIKNLESTSKILAQSLGTQSLWNPYLHWHRALPPSYIGVVDHVTVTHAGSQKHQMTDARNVYTSLISWYTNVHIHTYMINLDHAAARGY